jgi:hypothetical protein
MTSPVHPVRCFYDALGHGGVPGGQDPQGEDARQRHRRHPGRHVEISGLLLSVLDILRSAKTTQNETLAAAASVLRKPEWEY